MTSSLLPRSRVARLVALAALVGLAIVLIAVLTGPHPAWAGDSADEFEEARSRGWLWAYLAAFSAGLVTSLTPCVYPMIPIVIGIFGGRGRNVSRKRAVLLATVYVGGMGLMFAALGVIFALIGGQAGALLANPAVLIPILIVYLALALAMFGAYELQLPAGLQDRLAGVSGEGVGGAFAMGLVGGFTAAPCTGPFLLGLLGFVTQTQSVVLGGSLLFTYALGMGVLFWVLAAFAISLPKSGAWMEWMKSIGGIALVAVAIHFLRPILPVLDRLVHPSVLFMVAAGVLLIVALAIGAVHLSFHDRLAIKLRKGVAVGLSVVAITAGVTWLLHVDRRLPWVRGDEPAAFAQAAREHKGVMIDFWASWCTPCKELEHTFGTSPVYETIVDNFVPLQFDVTVDNDRNEQLLERYRAGTPTVIFLTADGRELGRVMKHVGPTTFMETLGPAAAAIKQSRQTAQAP